MNPKHYTIPIFIPELACPFQCVFCNQRKITGMQLIPEDEDIIRTIEEHLASFKEKERVVQIGFFGGSFTGIEIEQQQKFLELAQPYLKNQTIQSIRLSTRPDYINAPILDMLKSYGVGTIELGSQSLDDEVLKKSFRGHTAKQTEMASKLILEYGFELGLQMMIGLPGDTLEKSISTAKRIIELGALNTRIYPSLVIKDTALQTWYEKGKYTPLSLDEAVKWTSKILPLFERAGIKVLRVGLHPSEGLLSGEELVAGPFHPSFKELVLTHIWHELLFPLLQKNQAESIEILVPAKELNYAIGYKGQNKKMLQKKFKKVKVVASSKISERYNFQYH